MAFRVKISPKTISVPLGLRPLVGRSELIEMLPFQQHEGIPPDLSLSEMEGISSAIQQLAG
jgi:hypothetical protein